MPSWKSTPSSRPPAVSGESTSWASRPPKISAACAGGAASTARARAEAGARIAFRMVAPSARRLPVGDRLDRRHQHQHIEGQIVADDDKRKYFKGKGDRHRRPDRQPPGDAE